MRNVPLIVALTLLMTFPPPGLAADPPPSLEELIHILQRQERKLLNLRVEASSWAERRVEESGDWEKGRLRWDGTAWFDGMPGSKTRIEATAVMKWIDGAADFAEETFIATYDGAEIRHLQQRVGPAGETFRASHGRIAQSAGRTPPLSQGWNAGQPFSVYYFEEGYRQSLSQWLQEAIDAARTHDFISSDIAYEVVDGRRVLRVEFSGLAKETLWLDPERGWSPLRYLSVIPLKGNMVQDDWAVHELTEAAPGIWYPTSATVYTTFSHSDLRWQYRASSVVANDPDFDEAIFTLQFPPGTAVYDSIRDKTYVVAGEISDLQRVMDRTVEQMTSEADIPLSTAPAQPATVPATKQAPPARAEPAADQTDSARGATASDLRKLPWGWVAVASAALAAFAVTAGRKLASTRRAG